MYSSYDAFLNNMTDLYIVMILIVMARKTFERAHIVSVLSVLSVSALLMGVYQTITTSYEVRASEEFKTATRTIEEYKPIMRLSKNGKNVVILVMDKALNGLFPYILNEKPELADAFTGFTYYPNTLSFSACTLQAAPALYGGYEYTTYEMNQRQNESLKDKINESIKILPTLFSKNGFHSTLCDIPLGNLVEYGVPGVFDEIDDCEARELTKGDYDGLISSDEKKATDPDRMKRTFFYFSLTRTAPLMLQPVIYDKGNYNAILPNTVTNEFVRNYVVMKYLPEFTEVVDDKIDEFFVMHNYLAHEAAFLDPPDYMLKSVTNHNDTEGKSVTLNGRKMHIDNDKQLMHYDSNMITYLFLAKWLQRLKNEGVYDNTRIIIAADHGYPLEHFDDLLNKDIGLDAEYINPLLMVKDFDSRGPLKTDDSFMTNADVPTIAMNNVIDDPVNPFTGKLISSDEKDGGSLIVTSSNEWNVEWQFENAYNISDSHWYRVHDSIFDRDNWTVYEE